MNVRTYHLQLTLAEPSLLQTSVANSLCLQHLLIEEGFGKCSGPHLPHVG